MKNRATKFISLALCAVVLFAAVGTSVFALTGEGKESEDENQETTINASAEAETSKDETVYVLAGADGTVQKIIVSDWIKNAMAADSLEDKTELSDIENIKGNESFTLGGDNSCVWDAQGNDIYYQGNIEKELPVQMSVCYTLDGQAIAPEALAGQSGHIGETGLIDREVHVAVHVIDIQINDRKGDVGFPIAFDHFQNVAFVEIPPTTLLRP